MIEYIFNPTLWSILGLILIVLELTDGSKIFFLPFGLASIANGILIYFQKVCARRGRGIKYLIATETLGRG